MDSINPELILNLFKMLSEYPYYFSTSSKLSATTSVETFDNGTATVNTETCEGLGLDLETVKKDFEPLCTQVNEIVTAESFNELEAN